jgi:hypothetical protein
MENCGNCLLVCDLRQNAETVTAAIATAELAKGVAAANLLAASAQAGAEKLINDALGDGGYNTDLANALDKTRGAIDANVDAEQVTNALQLAGGEQWAKTAVETATNAELHCDGPRRGVRVPLVGVVIPLPFGKGNEYCGSQLRGAAQAIGFMGQRAVTAARNYMDQQPQG